VNQDFFECFSFDYFALISHKDESSLKYLQQRHTLSLSLQVDAIFSDDKVNERRDWAFF
jgi:hypothetical protein